MVEDFDKTINKLNSSKEMIEKGEAFTEMKKKIKKSLGANKEKLKTLNKQDKETKKILDEINKEIGKENIKKQKKQITKDLKKKPKKGSGEENNNGGTYDTEINKIMDNMRGYIGTFGNDEFTDIYDGIIDKKTDIKNNDSKFSFIINVADRNDKSEENEHWTCVFCDLKNGSCEFYDPLAENKRIKNIKTNMQQLFNTLEIPYMLKFKYNTIPNQGNSDLCGYYCMNFILCREAGIPFKQITNFSIGENERRMGELKNKVKKFGYI